MDQYSHPNHPYYRRKEPARRRKDPYGPPLTFFEPHAYHPPPQNPNQQEDNLRISRLLGHLEGNEFLDQQILTENTLLKRIDPDEDAQQHPGVSSDDASLPKKEAEEVKAEEEIFSFYPVEAKREIERLISSRAASSSRQTRVQKKKLRPDPPGSSLSSVESLEALRNRFGISKEVEFVVPRPTDRAHLPPADHFTVYEGFFDLCFLWFPIPEIKPRGLRYMIGILVRSYESRIDIKLDYLLNSLEICKAPGGKNFDISSKARRKIISGFPSKDSFWDDCFFFVRVNRASIGDNFIRKTKTDWGPLVRDFLPPCHDDLFVVWDTLAAGRTNWKCHFSLERVKRARSILVGVSVSSELSNSSRDTQDKLVVETFRERKKREAEEIAKRAEEIVKRGEVMSSPDEPRTAHKPSDEAHVVDSGDAEGKTGDHEEGGLLPRRPPTSPTNRKILLVFFSVCQFIAAVNELLAGYEADALKDERRVDEAKHDASLSKTELDKALARIAALEGEKGTIKADLDKAVIRFEESRVRKNSEIASLKRQIAAKDALLESRVKVAKKEDRHEAAAKFQERLAEIEKKMGDLEKAKRDENDLGQIRSNLVLIGDLWKPDASLDMEEEKLKSWEAELIGAEEVFEHPVTDLREKLVVFPVSPDSVDSCMGNKPLDVSAAAVGIVDPTGSNMNTPRANDLAAEGVFDPNQEG
ncbi:uncharacterized protein At3g60930, chloroplastic-like [Eutrema salsugineum]|uniref:uncharacterized protein At3g60930, chloroplastic-like n=1 Tax=Eutrema salsugineum TaxID=72664 RepID=UPI000CECF304|nr:uncharacterized protein At3g60930, chloroplastic-like [Eutrema salsugineum]